MVMLLEMKKPAQSFKGSIRNDDGLLMKLLAPIAEFYSRDNESTNVKIAA